MAADLPAVFAHIRALYARHEPKGIVLKDEPDAFMLGTHEVRAKDGYRTLFGGVEIRKAYVSAHLMPVYVHPDLLDGITPALRQRMQGKSCFNFKRVDADLFDELGRLIDAGAARFDADGRFSA